MPKTCFVIMPIGKSDSDDGRHFRAVYQRIKSIMERSGYATTRADDVQKSGLITKDIVNRLGESDIVVADVTDLNPNVFYELGVRHALRGRGTLIIQDDKRTPTAPFDVSAYRAIRFVGDLTGIDVLDSALTSFVKELESNPTTDRDNPVHDCFPTLPINVVDSASVSAEAPLRKELKVLHEKIKEYERAYGKIGSVQTGESPSSVLDSILSDARDGLLPYAIMEDLGSSASAQEIVPFLEKIKVVLDRNIRLKAEMFLQVASWAQVLDLGAVGNALLEKALEMYPSDPNLGKFYLMQLGYSDSPTDRAKARDEIRKRLNISLDAQNIASVQSYKVTDDMEMYGLLLDTYHKDDMHQEALAIAKKFAEAFPGRSKVIRNYARALERVGLEDDAIEMYRRSILLPDVDDTSARFFAAELHNRRRHRESAEVFALGCHLDSSDAVNFGELAEEVALAVADEPGSVPQEIAAHLSSVVVTLYHCAKSCPNRRPDSTEIFRRVFSRFEIVPDNDEPVYDKQKRQSIADRYYGLLKTELTNSVVEVGKAEI